MILNMYFYTQPNYHSTIRIWGIFHKSSPKDYVKNKTTDRKVKIEW